MSVVLLGAGGQLAHDLAPLFGEELLHAYDHEQLDICDRRAVERTLEGLKSQVVVNTAAYVRVDDAEGEPAAAELVNATAVADLAAICRRIEAKLVHFSTDYVFDGMKRTPYVESDPPHPINAYGASKLAGERAIERTCRDYLIVRTSGLYGVAGSSGKGGNFVETMIRKAQAGEEIRVVADQALAPTSTAAVAVGVRALIEAGVGGLVHLACQGECTWAEFAEAIFAELGLVQEVRAIGSDELRSPAKRPAYSVLTSERPEVKRLAPMPGWRVALQTHLGARAQRERPTAGMQ